MRTVLRFVLRAAIVLVVALVLIVGTLYALMLRRQARTWDVPSVGLAVPSDAAAIARGRRLVTANIPCGDCHGADFGGKVMVDDMAMGRLWASNLTRGRGGIAASYTDADWRRTLLHGVKPDGRSVVFMPSHEFHLTEAEAADIVAFFRAASPVDRQRPVTRIGPLPAVLSYVGMPLFPAELIDHATVRFAPPTVADTPTARGQALVLKGGCIGCHKADLTGGDGPPPGASNITPVGIGTWQEADFIRALRDHRRPNGTAIDEAMPRSYGQMSDDELRDILAYLKTVPARGNRTKRQG